MSAYDHARHLQAIAQRFQARHTVFTRADVECLFAEIERLLEPPPPAEGMKRLPILRRIA